MTKETTTARALANAPVRVFVSYDVEHDDDLVALLEEQAASSRANFEIVARSVGASRSDRELEQLRETIRQVDQVIVICGEHTAEAYPVAVELEIAQQEDCPYFLLWGRRQPMCTKPTSAKPADTMFSWTPDIVSHQLAAVRRREESDERAANLRRPRA
jgi:hypothetical protein